MATDRSRVGVLVPAYNEEATISNVVSDLVQSGYRVFVIDDGSSDRTSEFARAAGAVVLSAGKNQGYEGAVNLGFAHCLTLPEIEWIATFDADGQHLVEHLNEMVELAHQNSVALVLGVRDKKNRIAETVFGLYTKLFYGLSDPLSGIKLYRKESCKDWASFDTHRLMGIQLAVEIAKRGLSFREIPVQIRPRMDESRFASNFQGNVRIMLALFKVMRLYGIR